MTIPSFPCFVPHRPTLRRVVLGVVVFAAAACADNGTAPIVSGSPELPILGNGPVPERFTGEVWARGNVAYTTTWGTRGPIGNAVKIWDVSGNVPTLVDSLIVPSAVTLGDIQTSDDGKLLVVATELAPGSIMIYDLTDPLKPQLITRYSTALTDPGVHTAEVQRVNGKLYAFLSIDPRGGSPARLVIVDLTDPAAPSQVFTATMGNPYMHDVFVRDGILFTALWNSGVTIWDIGGVGSGTVANPLSLGSVITVGGQVHNIWWYHSAQGSKKYAFVGEEGAGFVGSSSSGDIHVLDVSNFASPREIAFYHLEGAGTHNFTVDEARGILYAAYYNAGIRAININGDLASCSNTEKSVDGRCDLGKMGREVAQALGHIGIPVYVWGVQLVGGSLYASDMLNGLWKLSTTMALPD